MVGNPELLQEIVAPLLNWYAENSREMPWRTEPTPYRVWISEIMLQQTRIEAAKPYYLRFMEELPDVRALAAVSDEKLLKLWEGLGYYSRARNLKKAAQQLVEKFDGALPGNFSELRALPGIGDYTAGAIASLAFGLPEPAVDGNVLRVIARLTRMEEDIMAQKTRRDVTEALREVYPTGSSAGAFTSALMELGEVLCIPNGEPHCEGCPLRAFCLAKKENCTVLYPKKSPKKARKIEQWTVFLFRCGEQYALHRRTESGLLASLWGFPMLPGFQEETAWEKALAALGFAPERITSAGEARHIFTHVEWEMRGLFIDCAAVVPSCDAFPGLLWRTPEEIRAAYAFPTAFRAFLKKL